MSTIQNRAACHASSEDDRQMRGLDDPLGYGDWAAYRAARNRFLAAARPQAMDVPPVSLCPDFVPEGWSGGGEVDRDGA